jgi:hypothetical protein
MIDAPLTAANITGRRFSRIKTTAVTDDCCSDLLLPWRSSTLVSYDTTNATSGHPIRPQGC